MVDLLDCYLLQQVDKLLVVVEHSTAAGPLVVAEPLVAVAFAACTADYTCMHNIVVGRSIVVLQPDFELLQTITEQLAFVADPADSHQGQQDFHRAS